MIIDGTIVKYRENFIVSNVLVFQILKPCSSNADYDNSDPLTLGTCLADAFACLFKYRECDKHS